MQFIFSEKRSQKEKKKMNIIYIGQGGFGVGKAEGMDV